MAEVTAQLWLAPIAPTRVPTPLPGFAYPPYGYPPVRLRCRALAGDGHAWCPAQQAPKQGHRFTESAQGHPLGDAEP